VKIPWPDAIIFAVLIGVSAVVPASDASARTVANPLLLAQATPSVSADEAAALVRARSGGRILDLRLENRARPPVYRVKVLLDGGRVRVYRVDASSGKILQ
jgi:uncharacterized membrane protein YkoI